MVMASKKLRESERQELKSKEPALSHSTLDLNNESDRGEFKIYPRDKSRHQEKWDSFFFLNGPLTPHIPQLVLKPFLVQFL